MIINYCPKCKSKQFGLWILSTPIPTVKVHCYRCWHETIITIHTLELPSTILNLDNAA